MKNTLIAAIVLLCSLFVSGCSSDATNRYAQARSLLTTTESTILNAHATGLIDNDDLVALDPYVLSARAGIAEAKAQIGTDGFDAAISTAEAALDKLTQEYIKAKADTPPPGH